MSSLIHEQHRPRRPWRVDYWEHGRQRTRRFTTKKEAKGFEGDLAKGVHASTTNLTLNQWVPRWIETHGPTWEARTRKDRSEAMDALVLPNLGKRRLRDLTRRDIREWRAALTAAGVTNYRAQETTRTLSSCLTAAVDDDLLAANPCLGLKALQWVKTEQEPATLTEVESIRVHMTTARDRAAVSLMAYGGLRPGEVMALDWRDVQDLTMVVRRGAGRLTGETKTGSTRTVPLIGVLADDLLELDRGAGLVLGIRHWTNWRGRVWDVARAAAGVSRAPKVLRHTAASLWIAEHRTSREVAYLLGHSTPRQIEETYGHLFTEAQLSKRAPDIQTAAARARRKAARVHAASKRAATRRAA